jgi:hypothetical protein
MSSAAGSSSDSPPSLGAPEDFHPGLTVVAAVQALLTAVVGALASLGFVAFVGGAVLWMRFWAVGLPPDQAVTVVPRGQLIATGASVLAAAAAFGLIAVGIAYIVDRAGGPSVATRVLLLLLAVGGVVLVVSSASPDDRHWAKVGPLLAVVAFAVWLVTWTMNEPADESDGTGVGGPERGDPTPPKGPPPGRASALGVLLLIVFGWFMHREGPEHPAPPPSPTRARPVRVTRAGRRVQLVVCAIGAGLLGWFVEDGWVVAGYALAIGLYLCVLGISFASKLRFGPFAVALFAAVVVFAAGWALLRAAQQQLVQPAVALRMHEADPVCGIFVAETSDRVYLGKLDHARAAGRPLDSGDAGHLFWVDRTKLAGWAVGSLDGQRNSERVLLALADRVLAERRVTVEETVTTERPAPAPPTVTTGTTPPKQATATEGASESTTAKRTETRFPRDRSLECTLYVGS